MCRNIRTLFNFEPPVTDDEIRAASIQFVRKLSGFNKPSKANEAAFERWRSTRPRRWRGRCSSRSSRPRRRAIARSRRPRRRAPGRLRGSGRGGMPGSGVGSFRVASPCWLS